jgi:hypothetical protein
MSMSSPVRILLAIDGSPSSDAAVNEVAHSTLVKGSAVEVLTVIHSRVPQLDGLRLVRLPKEPAS